ncbi:MAG: MFS transporter [Candidatus Heimdallarchaeota archaeon]|nr:MFS transporter [Candidatus Heimdallarchaeota archaeon]MCK4954948.1 MFS transporter [Candidatus Heimdallarchaeota archaeon]
MSSNDSFDHETNSDEINENFKVKKEEKLALYSRTIAVSTSRGLVQPFVSMIALAMGASSGLLGWIQSISNLLSTFLSPIFGRFSDKVRKRIPFIVISTITWGIPYAFLYFIDPSFSWAIVIVVALVNLIASLGLPAWSALMNELFPKEIRGKLTGRIFWFDAIGSTIATIFTGIVLTRIFKDIDYQKYILIPVAIGVFLSILGVLPFKKIEEPLKKIVKEEQPIPRKLNESFKIAFANKPFRKYTIISVIQSLFFSFAWPLFSIFQVKVLKATALEIAILSISFSISILLVIRLGAKLSDRFGRTKLIFFNRFMLVAFPVSYIFATEVWHLYIIHYVIAPFMFLGTPSVHAYLLDIVPPKEGGMYFGIFNMLTGVALFIGALVGGYLTEMNEFLLNSTNITAVLSINISVLQPVSDLIKYTVLNQNVMSDTLRLAVIISFIVVAIGRVLTSLLFLTLKEVKKFPASWGDVLRQIKRRLRIAPPV